MKPRMSVTVLSTTALAGVAVPAVGATQAISVPHQQRQMVSVRGSASVNHPMEGTVVVFTFRVTSHPASPDVWETMVSATNGQPYPGQSLVFTSCSYGGRRDYTGYGDGPDCEDLPASTKKPIVYLIGVTASAPGSTVSARLRVDTDGYPRDL